MLQPTGAVMSYLLIFASKKLVRSLAEFVNKQTSFIETPMKARNPSANAAVVHVRGGVDADSNIHTMAIDCTDVPVYNEMPKDPQRVGERFCIADNDDI